MPKHRQSGGNGDGGVPDWFFWTLALLALLVAAIIFMYGGRIWS